jgi:VWFA-related protein
MFPRNSSSPQAGCGFQAFVTLVVTVALMLAATGLPALAQSQSPTPPPQNQQAPPAEMGGPNSDVGPIAAPKKKEAPPPEKPKAAKAPAAAGEYSLRVDVPLVSVPVMVTTKNGQFIPGLKEQNFKVLEDGVPQRISSFAIQKDAPITAVLLVEFAANDYFFIYDALTAAYTFANTLKKEDWVAVEYYDMKPHILVDFTQNKQEILGALNTLQIPTWQETNLFDALYDTIDRLERVEGHKYLILISSGVDTFSRLNYDQVLKKVKDSHDITIFAISTGQWIRTVTEPYQGPIQQLTFAQADNQLNYFAKYTGGHAYFPRFEGEMRDIFGDIANTVRNEYVISYRPSNSKQDGTYRKIKIELTDGNGGALKIKDQKGKDVKPVVIAREGYKAKMEVE